MKAQTPHSGFSIKHVTEWTGFYVIVFAVLLVVGLWAGKKIVDHDLPAGHIQLSTTKSNYNVGDSVKFTLVNNFPSTIYVNNSCPGEPLNVYRYDGQKWIRIHDETAKSNCTQQQRLVPIKANTSISGTYDLWPNLFKQPGIYRIVAAVEHYEGLPYADFEVISPNTDKTTTPPASQKIFREPPPPRHESESENERTENLYDN